MNVNNERRQRLSRVISVWTVLYLSQIQQRRGGFFIMSCHYLESRLLPAMRNCVRGGRGGVSSSMCLPWYLLLLRSQGDKCLTVCSLVRSETSELQNLSAVSWHLMNWTVQCVDEWYITQHWSQILYEGVRFCVWLWIQTKKKIINSILEQ